MLKYLFTAVLADGRVIEQTPEDVSDTVPGKSRYYDVVNAGSPVVQFMLIGDGNSYVLDLLTGCFAVNDVPFRFHGSSHGLIREVELVYLREVRQDLIATLEGGEIRDMKNGGSHTIYRFGFKGLDMKGESFERVMEIE